MLSRLRLGIRWLSSVGIVTSRVFATIRTVDSVARADIQNMKLFNGEYGCAWCFSKGVMLQKGRGYSRAHEMNAMPREDLDFQKCVTKATASNPILGIKGYTPFMELTMFNMINGFVVDVMHCVYLGIMRQLCSLWFDSEIIQTIFTSEVL